MKFGILATGVTTKILMITGAVALAVVLFFVIPFGGKAKSDIEALNNDAFQGIIAGYTSGMMSTTSSIQVSFVNPIFDSLPIDAEVPDDLFDFTPNIDGKAQWVDVHTVSFVPNGQLPYGQTYQVGFHLHEIMDVDDDLELMEFNLQTAALHLDTEILGLSYAETKGELLPTYKAILQFSDYIDTSILMRSVSAVQGDKSLEINWSHKAEGNSHALMISGFERKDQPSNLELRIGIDHNEAQISTVETLQLPAKGDFICMGVRVVHEPDQYVVVQFSEPLDPNQNLDGLLALGTVSCSHDLEMNEIKLYPVVRQDGEVELRVFKGIKSNLGIGLSQDYAFTVGFEQLKPSVRWVDPGNILPKGSLGSIAFEAVALKEIDVEVVRIYSSNVLQFMQVNQLDGNDEIKRVGRPVLTKTVSLLSSGASNLMKWNKYQLDLSALTNEDPNAIYQVNLSFRMQQSAYACPESDTIQQQDLVKQDWDDPYDRYYYRGYSYYGYNYHERDNPCHVSYYINHGQGVQKNIMLSDLGLIAKYGKNKDLHFVLSSLSSAEPIAGGTITVYNLQQQPMATCTTGPDGIASVHCDNEPFIAVASHQGDKAYLRIDNSSSLSVSHFNTSGNETKDGLKGFIYGERGVWRPGDSLYITFMLQDNEELVPQGLPILFELENPRGVVVNRLSKTQNTHHVYPFRTKTDIDAPTGAWLARVWIGNQQFTKSIHIETIKPNRLKILLDLASKEITAADPYLRGVLSARWLHGAVASNMQATIQANMYAATTTFDKYPDYDFDDEARELPSASFDLFNGAIDAVGQANVEAEMLPGTNAPGKIQVKLKTTVMEHSGNASTDIFTIPFHPYPGYVGLKLPSMKNGWLVTDTSHLLQLACVNTNGSPVAGTRQVKVELWKLDWRWWWNLSADDLSNYVSATYRTPVVTATAEVVNGKGSYQLSIDRPNWGRFYLKVTDPATGHSTGKVIYVSWPYWAGQSNEMSGVEVLEFSADKETYQVGEKAKIIIPSCPNGRALVSLENGTGVLKQFWVDTKKGSSQFELPIEPGMAPNVYVHVSLIQPHASLDNDLPIRLYGIANIDVDDPATELSPTIALPPVLAPETEFTLEVGEENGRDMTYTIAIVDEGLLDITRFSTPDPHASFYSKEALGVHSFDLYKYVIGKQSGEMGHILGIGGDMELKNQESSKVNRFKPVAMYLGPFTLKKGSKQKHVIKMPYYVGSVRAMVIARQGNAYGHADATAPVRKPIMVLATLPRTLSPGEEVELPVSVFAMEDWVKNAAISLETNNLFEVVGPSVKNVGFKAPGEQLVFFTLKTKASIGKGQVVVTGKSGKENSKDQIDIWIRTPNPRVGKTHEGVLEANGKLSLSYTPFGIDGSKRGILEVSTIPPLQLADRLDYLIGYPYGCVEQTTSKGFAQLYLPDVVSLSESEKSNISNNIRATIGRLLSMQTADGGFAYWPGDQVPDEWGSCYAGHFLTEARNKGYSVPQSALDRWIKFQTRLSNGYETYNGQHNNTLMQAYRLYTLALANKPNLGAMNRLKTEGSLNNASLWRLAGAYAKAGQKDLAKRMMTGLETSVKSYAEMGYTYGSGLRDQAMILEVLVDMGEITNATRLVRDIANVLNNESWWSTQTTAYCLLSISKFALVNKTAQPLDFTYAFGKQTAQRASTKMPIARITLSESDINSGTLVLDNHASGTFFVQLNISAHPLQNETKAASSNLIMQVVYTDMAGNSLDVSTLPQGTSFKATVTLKHPGMLNQYDNMALNQMFPSGWEIVNTRLEGTDSLYKSSPYAYRDIRDDRVYTFFNLPIGQTYSYVTLLTANYIGAFYLPSASCEAMYDGSIYARTQGAWVKVIANKSN